MKNKALDKWLTTQAHPEATQYTPHYNLLYHDKYDWHLIWGDFVDVSEVFMRQMAIEMSKTRPEWLFKVSFDYGEIVCVYLNGKLLTEE